MIHGYKHTALLTLTKIRLEDYVLKSQNTLAYWLPLILD
jgi:hypothetical protein